MAESQDIPVDRGLRAFVGRLAMAIEASGLDVLRDNASLTTAPGLVAQLGSEGELSFERNFAGFEWHFTLRAEELIDVASGKVGEIPMQRKTIDPARRSAGSNESASIADSLLAAVGFGEGPSSSNDSLLGPPGASAGGSKVDFLPADNPEETALDEAEVTREEVDDLLNHPEVLKLLDMMGIDSNAPASEETVIEPEVEDRTEVDMRAPVMDEHLSPEAMPGATEDVAEDDFDGEEDEEEETSAAAGLQQAAQFLSLLLDAEKLELEDGAEVTALAARIVPLLDDETVGDRERATRLIDWLLDQPEVEDIYISDDEMTRILRAW